MIHPLFRVRKYPYMPDSFVVFENDSLLILPNRVIAELFSSVNISVNWG